MTVRERPILFSGPMVRAILDGSKSQTRRVVRLPADVSPDLAKAARYADRLAELRRGFPNGPESAFPRILGPEYGGQRLVCNLVGDVGLHVAPCPYGEPGDRLWVRETWSWVTGNGRRYVYRADGTPRDRTYGNVISGMVWKPSIFMPRHLCRLVLELSDVRVERVQDITEADAHAEGFCDSTTPVPELDGEIGGRFRISGATLSSTAAGNFAETWDSLNAKRGYGWDANPWVWVLSFRRIVEGDMTRSTATTEATTEASSAV